MQDKGVNASKDPLSPCRLAVPTRLADTQCSIDASYISQLGSLTAEPGETKTGWIEILGMECNKAEDTAEKSP